MAMTHSEKCAYGRGYSTGIKHRWPKHLPPEPPNEIIARLMETASALRNEVDAALATMDEGWMPEWEKKVDDFDEAMVSVWKWLAAPQAQERTT